MMTPASLFGHPIHAILVAFPIGLWTFSLACDLIVLSGAGGPAWSDTALYALGGGIVGALLAAVPGLIDLLSLTEAKTRRIAIVHMLVNLGAIALFAVDFGIRLGAEPGAKAPVLLSALGVAVISISGWLGGELVYAHGVGVHSSARPPEPGVSASGGPSGRRAPSA